jgi:tetratricopeptide (TPR) repeat protein
MRLVDIYIAKGDMLKAMKVVRKYKKDSRLKSMETDLEIKESQVYFYEGNLDTLTYFIKDNFSELSLDNNWHNDILEVRSLLFNFDKKPELFELFADSQLLLKKNKREEALRKLYQILESSEIPLTNLVKYQAAYILMLQGKNMDAIDMVNNLEGESIYIELSYILNGEIFDYLLNDTESAIDYYLEFLENYPNSIYYDQIRLRLRDLVG